MKLLELRLLISYYNGGSESFNMNSRSIKEANDNLVTQGLIRPDTRIPGLDSYCVTDKGDAHLEQILNLDFPKQVWIGENGKVLKGEI